MDFGLEIFIYILVAALLATCIWLLWLRRKGCRRQKLLLQQIRRFLEHPAAPAYCVVDDDFATLENAVADIESRLLAADENTVRESRKNADFLADISHQLKTPLAAMRLYCELDFGKGPHCEEQLELTLRMEKLIQSLLLMEKLKADAYPMHFEPCELRTLVAQVGAELQPLFPDRRLEIQGSASIRLDSDWMSEAIQNILKNACEHPAENPLIEVELIQTEASATIAISDHGGGMPEPELMKIFERFHRSIQTQSPGNAGLGLAITRTIVEKHHGTIFADNHGDGLRLTICLPILDGRLTI